jgi:hypothetical protein
MMNQQLRTPYDSGSTLFSDNSSQANAVVIRYTGDRKVEPYVTG